MVNDPQIGPSCQVFLRSRALELALDASARSAELRTALRTYALAAPARRRGKPGETGGNRGKPGKNYGKLRINYEKQGNFGKFGNWNNDGKIRYEDILMDRWEDVSEHMYEKHVWKQFGITLGTWGLRIWRNMLCSSRAMVYYLKS